MPTSYSPLLEVRGLSAAWDGRPALEGVDLEVGPGEYVVLMGPNGSGKTTLLRCISGFEQPTQGEVRFQDRSVLSLPPHRRGIGILFQEPSLFPRRSVRENIAYGLDLVHRPPQEVDRRVGELAHLLRLEVLLDRGPSELSGGERQRVALARTLAPGPELVLLDEPFASVDPEIKGEMRSEFRRALGSLGVAALHVTHDREEGLFLGDRVVLLGAGRVLDAGTPQDVFREPSSVESARFLGYNVVADGRRTLAVHPRDVELRTEGEGSRGDVEATGIVGDERVYVLRLATGDRIEARCPWDAPVLNVGSSSAIRWRRVVELDGRA